MSIVKYITNSTPAAIDYNLFINVFFLFSKKM